MRSSCRCLLIIRAFKGHTKSYLLRIITTVGGSRGRNHLTRLTVHVLWSCSLDSRRLYQDLLSWWIILLLVISAAEVTLSGSRGVHLDNLLNCLILNRLGCTGQINSSVMGLGCTWGVVDLDFLGWSRAWTQSSRKLSVKSLVCLLLSFLTQTNWGWLLQGRLHVLLRGVVRLLSRCSSIWANLLLLLIISLLPASIVSSLWSTPLILLIVRLVMLLILRIRISCTQIFIDSLIVMIGCSILVTQSCCSFIWVPLRYSHLRSAAPTTGNIVIACLSTLPIVALPIWSPYCHIFTTIGTATRLLILLTVSPSISSRISVWNTRSSGSRCRSSLVRRHLVATLVFTIIILLILCILNLKLVHCSIRVPACSWWSILLLGILLKLMWHVSMWSIPNSTTCLT